jgi:hypothetical protein
MYVELRYISHILSSQALFQIGECIPSFALTRALLRIINHTIFRISEDGDYKFFPKFLERSNISIGRPWIVTGAFETVSLAGVSGHEILRIRQHPLTHGLLVKVMIINGLEFAETAPLLGLTSICTYDSLDRLLEP